MHRSVSHVWCWNHGGDLHETIQPIQALDGLSISPLLPQASFGITYALENVYNRTELNPVQSTDIARIIYIGLPQ